MENMVTKYSQKGLGTTDKGNYQTAPESHQFNAYNQEANKYYQISIRSVDSVVIFPSGRGRCMIVKGLSYRAWYIFPETKHLLCGIGEMLIYDS